MGKFFLRSVKSIETVALPVEASNAAGRSDEPFGLLTIAAPHNKITANYSGDPTMHRALVSAILAAFVASAHAYPSTSTPIIKTEAAKQATLQKTSDTIKVVAPRDMPATAIKESTPPAVSAWGKYGTLLATLIVMCAIAVRRQRMGRS